MTTDISGELTHHRRPDTARAYALERLTESGEVERVRKVHAEYYRDLFERAETEWGTRPAAECLAEYERQINNLRAALGWAVSPDGDASTGIALATAAVPLWMHLSLIAECCSRVEQALAALGAEPSRNAPCGMKLYAALATSLIYTGGTRTELEAAWGILWLRLSRCVGN